MNERFWRHADYLHIKLPSFIGEGMREIVIKRGGNERIKREKGSERVQYKGNESV